MARLHQTTLRKINARDQPGECRNLRNRASCAWPGWRRAIVQCRQSSHRIGRPDVPGRELQPNDARSADHYVVQQRRVNLAARLVQYSHDHQKFPRRLRATRPSQSCERMHRGCPVQTRSASLVEKFTKPPSGQTPSASIIENRAHRSQMPDVDCLRRKCIPLSDRRCRVRH